MPTIKKATIKAYDPATHTATVQVAGSLGVWLDTIRVATDIPAADVVAGRQCTVLFLDPANQDDAVVLTIQGALPSGGGGGATDHGALTGLGDDDHPQYGHLSQAETWAALQTFGAGLKLAAAQTIQDSGGAGRILLATASPHVTLTGDLRVDRVAIGGAFASATDLLTLAPGALSGTTVRIINITAAGSTLTGNNGALEGLSANPLAILTSGITGISIRGLLFQGLAAIGGAGTTIAEMAAIWARNGGSNLNAAITDVVGIHLAAPLFVVSGSSTITNAIGLKIDSPTTTAVPPTNAYLIDAAAPTAGTNRYGIRIADITAGTIARILELGPAQTPHLRLEGSGNWAPGINTATSPLLILMGNNDNPLTKTLRRVQWKDGAAIGAGDRVLVAV